MVKKIATEVELQNECIRKACQEMADFLVAKNTSYDGSAFKEIMYGGRLISPIDSIDIRVTDKIRRLQSTNPEFKGEDTESDLAGYLIVKRSVKMFQDALKAIAKEEKQRQTTARVKEVVNNPETKKARRTRVAQNEPASEQELRAIGDAVEKNPATEETDDPAI